LPSLAKMRESSWEPVWSSTPETLKRSPFISRVSPDITWSRLAAWLPSSSSPSFFGVSPKTFHHCFSRSSLSNFTPTSSTSLPATFTPPKTFGETAEMFLLFLMAVTLARSASLISRWSKVTPPRLIPP